jgi:hypothetical protein
MYCYLGKKKKHWFSSITPIFFTENERKSQEICNDYNIDPLDERLLHLQLHSTLALK